MAKVKTHAEHQRDYHQRMIAAGMVRLSVWVPRTARDTVRAAIRKMESKWRRDGLMPEPQNKDDTT